MSHLMVTTKVTTQKAAQNRKYMLFSRQSTILSALFYSLLTQYQFGTQNCKSNNKSKLYMLSKTNRQHKEYKVFSIKFQSFLYFSFLQTQYKMMSTNKVSNFSEAKIITTYMAKQVTTSQSAYPIEQGVHTAESSEADTNQSTKWVLPSSNPPPSFHRSTSKCPHCGPI